MGFYNTFHNINEHTDKIKVIADCCVNKFKLCIVSLSELPDRFLGFDLSLSTPLFFTLIKL